MACELVWNFRQLRTRIHDNHCDLTIRSHTGQHSQFLRCFNKILHKRLLPDGLPNSEFFLQIFLFFEGVSFKKQKSICVQRTVQSLRWKDIDWNSFGLWIVIFHIIETATSLNKLINQHIWGGVNHNILIAASHLTSSSSSLLQFVPHFGRVFKIDWNLCSIFFKGFCFKMCVCCIRLN